MTAVVMFPGQGSQKPGFLAPWLESESHRVTLERLSDASGVDLLLHGTESDAETIRDTAVAQRLIVAAGILTWDALHERLGDALDDTVVAGHSVGEIAAAYAAGVFDAETAMKFVAVRADAMAKAASETATGMSAVVGGDSDAVLARLHELDLEPANFNGGRQIVAAGAPDALEALRAEPPAGARVIPLKVAGAFHTRFMADAREAVRAEAAAFPTGSAQRRLLTNASGEEVGDGARYLELLIEQIAQPVRWDACMARFQTIGADRFVEAAPAGTLVGLVKRVIPESERLSVNTPADLDAAQALLAH